MAVISPINLSQDIIDKRIGDVTTAELLNRYIREMGIDHAQYYGLAIAGSHLPVSLGTFTNEWLDHYIKGHYFFDDPVIEKTKDLNHPLPWSMISGLTERQEEFMAFTRRVLGRNGVTVPLGAPPVVAGISVVSDMPEDEWNEKLPRIIWNATIVGQKIHNIVLADKNFVEPSASALTRMQKTCLALAATGLDAAGISGVTSMSEKAVLRQFDAAQVALNARNHTHALAKAITLGYLEGHRA